jgi:uncharacterized protein YbjQ (UPF0145 family)
MPVCLKCGHNAADVPQLLECPRCGGIYSKLQALAAEGKLIRKVEVPTSEAREAATARARELAAQPALATEARLAEARLSGNWAGVAGDVVQLEAARVVIVSTPTVPGFCIDAVCGIVGGEHAYAFGAVFEEIAGFFRNVAGGGTSHQTVSFLKEARGKALQALRFAALDAGANAVVGVTFDYEEFSGANQRGVYVVIATGTAVRISKAAPVT